MVGLLCYSRKLVTLLYDIEGIDLWGRIRDRRKIERLPKLDDVMTTNRGLIHLVDGCTVEFRAIVICLSCNTRERVTCLYDVDTIGLWRISDERNPERHPRGDDTGIATDRALIHPVDGHMVGL